jgi:Zn-dependent protease
MNCQKCGQETFMPFRCPYCGGLFCDAHRLPENHACPRMDLARAPRKDVPPQMIAPRASSYEYSISFGQPRQTSNRVYMSPKEAKHLTVAAALVVAIGFSMIFYLGYMSYMGWTWTMTSAFALLLTASFLIHEMAHKITAQKRGLWAEFRLTTWGALLTLASVILPFKLISPGAVMISGPAKMKEIGEISIAGPSVNLILEVVFVAGTFLSGYPYTSLFALLAFINATIAVFNLIPFGILDGYKIYTWNKMAWALMFAVAVAFAIPAVLMSINYLYLF